MPVNTREVLLLTDEILKNSDVKMTLKSSGYAAVGVAAATFLGGLLGGRPGLLAGAAAGSALAYSASDDFKPIHQIFADLPAIERDRFADRFRQVFSDVDVTDLKLLLVYFNEKPDKQKLLIDTARMFIEQAGTYSIAG